MIYRSIEICETSKCINTFEFYLCKIQLDIALTFRNFLQNKNLPKYFWKDKIIFYPNIWNNKMWLKINFYPKVILFPRFLCYRTNKVVEHPVRLFIILLPKLKNAPTMKHVWDSPGTCFNGQMQVLLQWNRLLRICNWKRRNKNGWEKDWKSKRIPWVVPEMV